MSKTRKVYPNGDTYCSECKKIRSNNERKRNPERFKEYCKRSRVKKSYGITIEDAREMFVIQGESCAICNKKMREDRSWHIDHSHITGEVRGILCHNCNTAIGLLKEDKTIIKNALDYLSKAGKSRRKK